MPVIFLFLLPVFFFQMTKSVTNPEELGGLASQMTNDYGHLALQGRMAAATAEPEEVCSFRPLYSLYTVAPTWVFFYCREYNKHRVK